MNLVVIRGTLSSEPRERVLPSGTVLLTWEVTTETPDGKWSVPVRWTDPSRSVRQIEEGDDVVVYGGVRRRFAKVGGATRSFVEVVAARAARPTRRRDVEALTLRARRVLDELALIS